VEQAGSSAYLRTMIRKGHRIPTELHADYEKCREITTSHYENFPVGSFLIPAHLRPHVYCIYAFARTADDFADEPGLDRAGRLDHLKEWNHRLDTATTNPQGVIFRALGHTLAQSGIPTELFSDLLSAFRQDVVQQRHETWEGLLDYASRSANPVGRIILHLFGYPDEHRAALSDKICTALQFANFWQDVAIDAGRGRIYLPAEEMVAHGVEEPDLNLAHPTPGLRSLLDSLVRRTHTLFDQGSPLPERVSGRLRYELRMTWLCGVHILNRIQAADYDVNRGRPRLRGLSKLTLLFRTFRPVDSRGPVHSE